MQSSLIEFIKCYSRSQMHPLAKLRIFIGFDDSTY